MRHCMILDGLVEPDSVINLAVISQRRPQGVDALRGVQPQK